MPHFLSLCARSIHCRRERWLILHLVKTQGQKEGRLRCLSSVSPLLLVTALELWYVIVSSSKGYAYSVEIYSNHRNASVFDQ
jgi:hypothetical protein